MRPSRMNLAWGLVIAGLLVEAASLELGRRIILDSQRAAPGPAAGLGVGIALVFVARLLAVAAIVSCGLLVAGGVVGARESRSSSTSGRAESFLWTVVAFAGLILLVEGSAMVPFVLRTRASRAASALASRQDRDFLDRHWVLRGGAGPIREAWLAGDARFGTSAGDEVVFWDVISGEEVSRRQLPYDKARHLQLHDLAVSRDSSVVAAVAGGGQRAILGWGPDSTSELPWRAEGSVSFAVRELVGDGRLAWVHRRLYQFDAGVNREEEGLALVDLGEAGTGGMPDVLREHDLADGVLLAAAVDRQGRRLAVAVRRPPGSAHVRIFDAVEGGLVEEASLPTLPRHDAPIAVASSGRLFAYDDGQRSRVVDLGGDGKDAATVFELPSAGVLAAVAFDADDRRVGFCHREDLPVDFGRAEWQEDPLPIRVHVVDLATGERRVASIMGNRHQARGRGLFTPDLSQLVLPGWETLFRYDVASGSELLRGDPSRPAAGS